MLAKRFEHILHDLGMAGLEHPLFYHAPVGIRFKIGGEEPIYLDRRAAKLKTNPAYVQGALDRAAAIYRALPAVPDLLRIDGYPDEEPAESLLTVIRQRVGLPVPDEQLSATEQDEDGDICSSHLMKTIIRLWQKSWKSGSPTGRDRVSMRPLWSLQTLRKP